MIICMLIRFCLKMWLSTHCSSCYLISIVHCRDLPYFTGHLCRHQKVSCQRCRALLVHQFLEGRRTLARVIMYVYYQLSATRSADVILFVLTWFFGICVVPSCWKMQLYSVSQKKFPLKFSDIFPKRLGIFNPNFTCLLYVPIYAELQIFIQLSAILTEVMQY